MHEARRDLRTCDVVSPMQHRADTCSYLLLDFAFKRSGLAMAIADLMS